MKSNNQIVHELMGLCWHNWEWFNYHKHKCSKCGVIAKLHERLIFETELPPYDTNIADANKCLNFLTKYGWNFGLGFSQQSQEYYCQIWKDLPMLSINKGTIPFKESIWGTSREKKEEAIVEAFIKALEKTE